MKKFLYLIVVFTFISCHIKKPSPFKGYETGDGIIYYKYSDLGIKKGGGITFGKVMEVSMTYSKLNDSVFFKSDPFGRNSSAHWFHVPTFICYDSLTESKSFLRLLLKTSPGDSVNFIIPAVSFFDKVYNTSVPNYMGGDTMVKVNVRVINILDSGQYVEKKKTYTQLARDMEMKELVELNRYLNSNKITEAEKGGIYLVTMKVGTGDSVKPKSIISISYRGYFMNGKTFDSVPKNDPLKFAVGDSAQVIAGLETGIKKMNEGEIAKIIIPSHSAFGEKGSSTGIVPPYTTVIYEVTMLKVTDPNNN